MYIRTYIDKFLWYQTPQKPFLPLTAELYLNPSTLTKPKPHTSKEAYISMAQAIFNY